LPTFAFAWAYDPTFLQLYVKYLRTLGVSVPCDAAQGSFKRYSGDTSVPGKGEILVWQPNVAQ
jgi:hypothetical protein